MMTFADKILAGTLIFLAVLAIIFQSLFLQSAKGERVLITVDGELYASYEFAEEIKTVEVETEFGSNTVKIDESSAWVEKASCPDKLDVKEGKISKTNQRIICLPNRLLIEISGGESKVDKVTY